MPKPKNHLAWLLFLMMTMLAAYILWGFRNYEPPENETHNVGVEK